MPAPAVPSIVARPTANARPRAATRVDNVQALRAFAAFVVVIGHCLHEATFMPGPGAAGRADVPYDTGFGVDVFFAISGFIMVVTAARGFGSPAGAARFLSRRLARVVPLYWLLTGALIAGAALAPSLLDSAIGGPAHAVASLLFYPSARPAGDVRPVLALGWSLDYEMEFYVLFALAMLLPWRRGIAALCLGLEAFVLWGLYAKPTSVALAYWSAPIALEFAMGVAIGALFVEGRRLSAPVALALAAVGLALGARFGGETTDPGAATHFLRYGVPAALLVAAAALGPRWSAWPRAFAFAVALGDASYALYLGHPFVLRALRAGWTRGHPPGSAWPLYVALASLAAVGFAFALHRFVETPLSAWTRRALDGRGVA